MFAVRVLTAAALLAGFFAALLLLDHWLFAVLVGAIIGYAAREWAVLAGMIARQVLAYAAGCALLYAALTGWLWPVAVAAVPVLAILTAALFFWGVAVPYWLVRGVSLASRKSLAVAGAAVLLPAAVAMIALPPMPLVAVLGLVWTADISAYLAGRALGRHRLAPAVSPGKTWEGVAGALLASLAYAVILALFIPGVGSYVKGMFWIPYLAGAAVLCISGILGDLFESAVKRRAGVKDSGALLPGHGGVLDRIDSATAVLPLGALLFSWFGAT